MTDAVVIPFPKTSVQGSKPERFRQALEQLQSALGEQRRALSDWRFAMVELSVGVAGLGHALGNYQDSLRTVETRLNELRIDSLRRTRRADTIVAQTVGRCAKVSALSCDG